MGVCVCVDKEYRQGRESTLNALVHMDVLSLLFTNSLHFCSCCCLYISGFELVETIYAKTQSF